MSFDDDLNACAALVEKGDPARFRTVMAAPLEARRALFPLYALNVEISRAPWVTAEPMIAEMRLQWWRDALEEIAAGEGVRRHEVVTPLSRVLSVEDARALDDLVAARRWDCYKDPFEDQAHLTKYIEDTSGILMSVAARMLGGEVQPAAQAGFGVGVANWLRAIPDLEAQKRVPLVDGTAQGVRDFAKSGLQSLQSANVKIAKPVLPAFWPATGARRILTAALKHPGLVAEGALPEPSRAGFTLKAFLGRW